MHTGCRAARGRSEIRPRHELCQCRTPEGDMVPVVERASEEMRCRQANMQTMGLDILPFAGPRTGGGAGSLRSPSPGREAAGRRPSGSRRSAWLGSVRKAALGNMPSRDLLPPSGESVSPYFQASSLSVLLKSLRILRTLSRTPLKGP